MPARTFSTSCCTTMRSSSQWFAYSVAEQTFLFDKIAKMVSLYTSEVSILSILGSFSRRGVKGYIIYDVALKGHQPSTGLPCKGWGMIVVTSPNKNNYESWAKLVRAKQIIINCPEENDVRAMCVWMKHNGQLAEEEADYWKKVNGRMDKVGPLLRYIFDESEYKSRIDSCESKVNSMNLFDTYYYSILGTNEVCDDSHISHKVVKVKRLRGKEDAELPLNALISSYLGNLVTCKLAELMAPNDFILLVLAIKDDLLSKALEKYSVFTFLSEGFVNAIIPKLKELKLKKKKMKMLRHIAVRWNHIHMSAPSSPLFYRYWKNLKEKIKIEYRVLYKPVAQNFPLVDAFFFMESPQKTLVGLQITTASEHHTIPSTVNLFKVRMASYFNGWEEFSEGLSWEIIYIQHADSTPMTGWQRCGPLETENLTLAENVIVAFWKENVRQYQVSVSSRDFPREEAPPTVEEQRQQETNS
ncbi:putative retrotransposon hot spot (RHS) protein [Trypanosoma cruzi]|uniref:Putative retrotransposon hot spot (RHS) protein n=1 Tax=Trypanosoma cruzi TaxID=5693 RepID=A0A2V2V7Q9_TRYCR|nr:putative retrotransposon hot spot (RHS) protein [Trypanosoma cruzi]